MIIINDQLILWMDFLTNKSQRVLVSTTFSATLFLASQRAGSSLLLFILYTDDCLSSQSNDLCFQAPSQHPSTALHEFVEW